MAIIPISQTLDLKEFVSLNISYINFFGYFSPQFETGSRKKIYHRVYSFLFVGVSFFLVVLSQVANMVASFGDIEKMTDATFLLFTNFVQATKLYCFRVQGGKVWSLVNSVDREIFQPRNEDQRKMLTEEIKMAKFVTRLLHVMCTVTCLSWAVSPYLDAGEEGRRLPLSGWYPFNTDKSPVFEGVFVYQILTTWINGLADLSMDSLISATIMMVSGQLSLLNSSLEEMNQVCGENSVRIGKDQDSSKEPLVRNVVHYRNIIQFANGVSSLFSTCITTQFIFGGLIICMSMFQMSIVSVISFKFFAMSIYQACMLLELYIWCYYGNEVLLKSDKLTQSAYMCEWIGCSKDFKNNLRFFMTRSQFPLKLYASGYFTLSLETFKAIVKSSWSYFVVLNQVHAKDI